MLRSQLHAIGAVLIEGVKGCGKTSTARQLAASEVLLDIDPDAELRAELDPRLLLDGDTPRLRCSRASPSRAPTARFEAVTIFATSQPAVGRNCSMRTQRPCGRSWTVTSR